jgi:hypothetical protein
MDYLGILKKIYKPEIGSVWRAPNRIWTNKFARNGNPELIHPSIVATIRQDNVSVQLAPGTTREYCEGSCVFKVDLNDNGTITHFLLKFSMPFAIDDLLDLDRGWHDTDDLSEQQLIDLNWQKEICRG